MTPNTDAINSSLELIARACRDLNMSEHHVDNVVNTARAGLPREDESPHLPTDLVTGFGPIDYLIAPVKNNTRIHIYGRASSAKTAIIAHVVNAMMNQFDGLHTLWLDSTYKLNKKFFTKFGFNDNLNFLQASTVTNEILNIILSGKYRLLVIDDVASFKQKSSTMLYRILYYCRTYKIMVWLANQVREVPKTGRIYSSKQELLTSYDLTLRTMKYRVHYDQKFSDYDVKLEYHQHTGRMDGESVVIPISTTGHVKDHLMKKRLDRMASVADHDDFESYINERMKSD